MFKLFRLKWKKELQELQSIHDIAMREKEAAFALREKELLKDSELKTRETVSLLKLEQEQRIAQLKLESDRKIAETEKRLMSENLSEREKGLKENYEKLSAAMSKLHEEGNVTTKFVQDLAIKMFEGAPQHKSQVKVITDGSSEK